MQFVPSLPPVTTVPDADDLRPVSGTAATRPVDPRIPSNTQPNPLAAQAAAETAPARTIYVDRREDRRKIDRRITQKPVLLDTRSKADRRQQNRREDDDDVRSISIEV